MASQCGIANLIAGAANDRILTDAWWSIATDVDRDWPRNRYGLAGESFIPATDWLALYRYASIDVFGATDSRGDSGAGAHGLAGLSRATAVDTVLRHTRFPGAAGVEGVVVDFDRLTGFAGVTTGRVGSVETRFAGTADFQRLPITDERLAGRTIGAAYRKCIGTEADLGCATDTASDRIQFESAGFTFTAAVQGIPVETARVSLLATRADRDPFNASVNDELGANLVDRTAGDPQQVDTGFALTTDRDRSQCAGAYLVTTGVPAAANGSLEVSVHACWSSVRATE